MSNSLIDTTTMANDREGHQTSFHLYSSNIRDEVPQIVSVYGQKLQTTKVFDCYWEFACKRQQIFWERIRGNPYNSCRDSILSQYKFTNVYRASDRVSQFLIRNVIYEDDSPSDIENTFFRIMLFKLFNSIETWQAIVAEFGTVTLNSFLLESLDKFLTDRLRRGVRVYSAAYMMPSGASKFKQTYKHSNHLHLLRWMIEQDFPRKLHNTTKMEEGFRLMNSAPFIGSFLAYQYITDINYSNITDYSEKEFVVPGPGARDGISKCFVKTDGVSEAAIIKYMTEAQQEHFEKTKQKFENLWGRDLQLIDCQNLFCEISKYARVAYPEQRGIFGRTRIKQKFRPRGDLPMPMYPPSWGLNDKIEKEFRVLQA